MNDNSQQSTPENKRSINNKFESPHKRFSMFSKDEDHDTTVTSLRTGETAVQPVLNDALPNDTDVSADKSPTLSTSPVKKVSLLFKNLRTLILI